MEGLHVYISRAKFKSVIKLCGSVLLIFYLFSFLKYKLIPPQNANTNLRTEPHPVVYSIQKSIQLSANRYDGISEWTDLDDISSNEVDCSPLVPCIYPDSVDFRILVLTYNRAESLRILLQSLDQLEMDGDQASLEIWLDRSISQKVHRPTLAAARSFTWSRGKSRVHVHKRHVGLYGQWIDTWSPKNTSKLSMEIAVILEDDMIVSPYSYRWLKAVHIHYRLMPEFFGTTLESDEPKGPQNKKPRLYSQKNTTVFWYAFSGTWGTSPSPKYWHEFQTWYHHIRKTYNDFKPYVPGSVMTAWYKQFEKEGRAHEMWDMWLLYYMYKEKLFAIRNNLELYNGNKKSCLSINRKERGLHFSGKAAGKSKSKLLQVWSEEYVSFPHHTPKVDINANVIS